MSTTAATVEPLAPAPEPVRRGRAATLARATFKQSRARVGLVIFAVILVIVIFGELLPNVTSPLMVETGLRLTYSIGLIAAISFLGLGIQPPHADWGLMINENRLSLIVQPWGVMLPVLAIALLTVSTGLMTDSYARVVIGIERGE